MPIDLEAMQTGRWTPADVWATIAELRAAHARVAELEAEAGRLREAAGRAKYILRFHAIRCPLNPMTNHSGMEEHLAMYRAVLKELDGLNLPDPFYRAALEDKP